MPVTSARAIGLYGAGVSTATHTFANPGLVDIQVFATDTESPTPVASPVLPVTVTVSQASISAGGPYTIAEGQTLNLAATALGTPTGYSWDVNNNTGAAFGQTASLTWAQLEALGHPVNDDGTFAITSRGYGAGQFTIFHHPPRQDEVDDFMNDVTKNLSKAEAELREKFDKFVNCPSDTADDRQKEIGNGPLRLCKYASSDSRYLNDCKQCAIDAGSRDIVQNETPWYAGSPNLYVPTQYYASANYPNTPKRESPPNCTPHGSPANAARTPCSNSVRCAFAPSPITPA